MLFFLMPVGKLWYVKNIWVVGHDLSASKTDQDGLTMRN